MSRTVKVDAVRIVHVGRVRRLWCYTCGATWHTVEVDAPTMADVMAGDVDLAADLFRAVSPVQEVMP